ncbi:MAG: signal peptidase I [Candidatus Bathyarchaeia archaeon]
MNRSKTYLVFFVLVTFFLVCRLTGLPFGVFIVVGKSMEPTLYAGDLVLVCGKDYGVGDIVVWSRGVFSHVMHRVVNVSSSYIITRGDNNPVDDPPVPLDAVEGRMVFHVPRIYWMASVLTFFGVYVFLNRKHVVIESFEKASSTVLLTMTLIMFSLIVFSPIMYPNAASVRVPSIHLASLLVDGGTGDVIIKYSLDGLWIENVTGCMVYSKSYSIRCPVDSVNDTVFVHVPREYYSMLNEVGERSFFVRLNASLSHNASLLGNYIVYPVFSRLRIERLNSTVTVFNNNIFPVKANVTIYSAEKVGGWDVDSKTIVLGSGERIVFDLGGKRFSYFQISYMFAGKPVTEKVQVTFDDKV